MARFAYLECPTGIAGDMCLGALVHAGVPLDYLSQQLGLLGIASEYRLEAELVHRNGQQATKVHVHLNAEAAHPSAEAGVDPHTTFAHSPHSSGGTPPAPPHLHSHAPTRHLPEIEQMIASAGLPARAESWSLAVFRQLARAEGAVHGIAPEQVHFHEVGATDAIVDIVGTCLGLDWLGIDRLCCSPLPTGGGIIRAAHGRLPVPTPAVLKLWEMRQVPIYSNGIQRELVTPTGAAIATTLAVQFGAPPAMTLHKVGLGAGSRDLPIPNLLRLWIGEGEESALEGRQQTAPPPIAPAAPDRVHVHHAPTEATEPIALLETQIDDLNPQAVGFVYDVLFAAGAVDVFTQAIGMKKSRPGMLLSVVCHPQDVPACERVLFRETTTLGIRRTMQQRAVLQREFQAVETEHGTVRVKVARSHRGEILNAQPEYEDCAAIARQTDRPWREVHQSALQRWHEQQATQRRSAAV